MRGASYYNYCTVTERKQKGTVKLMSRKLIIEGNAVYEIDEECMLKQRIDEEKREHGDSRENRTEMRRDKN